MRPPLPRASAGVGTTMRYRLGPDRPSSSGRAPRIALASAVDLRASASSVRRERTLFRTTLAVHGPSAFPSEAMARSIASRARATGSRSPSILSTSMRPSSSLMSGRFTAPTAVAAVSATSAPAPVKRRATRRFGPTIGKNPPTAVRGARRPRSADRNSRVAF